MAPGADLEDLRWGEEAFLAAAGTSRFSAHSLTFTCREVQYETQPERLCFCCGTNSVGHWEIERCAQDVRNTGLPSEF